VSGEHAAVLAALAAIVLLLVPLPGFVLDVLLTLNLAFALAVLVVGVRAAGPESFAVLPQVLVAGSLARVALAIGLARAILSTGGGGALVRSLGATLSGGGEGLLGGAAVFGLLALTAYAVLNLGLTRLAEVAARFALDALPGRQMALDSALNAGRMDAAAATAQTERLEAENSFYGAMDGAARFLRGETLAVLAITVLTPAVAAASGMAAQWRELAVLAVGQGAVILVPGLLVGAAAALVLSRSRGASAREDTRGHAARPGLVLGVAVVLLALGLTPGMAKGPLLVMALVLGGAAWLMARHGPGRAGRPHHAEATGPAGELQLRLGLGLVPLSARHDLPAWAEQLRGELSDELGLAVPPFTMADDAQLSEHDFAVLIGESRLAQGTLRLGRRLAVSAGEEDSHRGAMRAREAREAREDEVVLPDGRRGVWVRSDEEATNGARLLEPLEALALQVRAAVRQVAPELCDLQRAHELIEMVRVSHPAVVTAYEAAGLSEADLQDVGRELLAEGLPLTERVSLLSAMAREPGRAGRPHHAEMAEAVRPALRRTITRLVAPEGMVQAVELARELQEELAEAAAQAGPGRAVALEAERAARWRELLQWVARWCGNGAAGAVIVCAGEARRAVAQLAREAGVQVAAVRPEELLPLTEVQVVHVLSGNETGEEAEEHRGAMPARDGDGRRKPASILGRGRAERQHRRGE
jgi:flagellar biosynthesis component FlhA